MQCTRKRAPRKCEVALPLIEWGEARRRAPQSLAGRWVARRFAVPPSLAETVASAAGLRVCE
jgi:hypothetical protein